ncbi:MAG TPA: hypothetical protein VMX35_07260 [Acidobacteriota bacterium]|nr:hypothetical protein [Acidobacteriota bacterium]
MKIIRQILILLTIAMIILALAPTGASAQFQGRDRKVSSQPVSSGFEYNRDTMRI